MSPTRALASAHLQRRHDFHETDGFKRPRPTRSRAQPGLVPGGKSRETHTRSARDLGGEFGAKLMTAVRREMLITSSYAGTAIGKHRYLFFTLYEDYNDLSRGFVQEFEVHLERLARNLGESGAVVRSFAGDIETTRVQVFAKPWTPPRASGVGEGACATRHECRFRRVLSSC